MKRVQIMDVIKRSFKSKGRKDTTANTRNTATFAHKQK